MSDGATLMTKKGMPNLPQPPWSQAPVEVVNWLASVGGPRQERLTTRTPRARGFVAQLPSTSRNRVLRRLARAGFQPVPVRRPRVREAITDSVPVGMALPYVGESRTAKAKVQLRRTGIIEIRVSFMVRMSLRQASRLASKLGLIPLTVRWL